MAVNGLNPKHYNKAKVKRLSHANVCSQDIVFMFHTLSYKYFLAHHGSFVVFEIEVVNDLVNILPNEF